jgi:hypothetical protein
MVRVGIGIGLLVLVLLAPAPPAAAQMAPPPPPSGYGSGYGYPPAGYAGYPRRTVETHDGFYLRMFLGFGYMQSHASVLGNTEKLYGPAYAFDLALGGAVAENLIVFGELALINVDSPTVSFAGTSATGGGASVDHAGVGPGVAYYLMPLNLYLSGAVIFGRVQVQDKSSNDVVGQTKVGVGLNLVAGKEWWVSANWGLGVALHFMVATNTDSSSDLTPSSTRFTTTGGTIAFSATYN